MRRLIGSLIMLAMAGPLTGCSDSSSSDPGRTESFRVEQRLGAPADAGFKRATTIRDFLFPGDHGPHPDFATEWWYFTGNLSTADGRRFGYQLTLFRVALAPGAPANDSGWRTHQLYMGHLALSDIAQRQHLSTERFSRAAAGLAGATADPLEVWLGPWSITGSDTQSHFPLQLDASSAQFSIQLTLEKGNKGVVLQGDRGLSLKSAQPGNASYYYSHSRLPTHGRITIGDTPYEVAGNSWFDREWSSSALGEDQAGWDWFALQLDDGRDLMFYQMRDKQGLPQSFSQGALIGPDGSKTTLSLSDIELRPSRFWTSESGTVYPVAWRMTIPAQAIDLQIESTFDQQEMPLTVRYWEGAVEISGSHRGVGYLELSGYAE